MYTYNGQRIVSYSIDRFKLNTSAYNEMFRKIINKTYLLRSNECLKRIFFRTWIYYKQPWRHVRVTIAPEKLNCSIKCSRRDGLVTTNVRRGARGVECLNFRLSRPEILVVDGLWLPARPKADVTWCVRLPCLGEVCACVRFPTSFARNPGARVCACRSIVRFGRRRSTR